MNRYCCIAIVLCMSCNNVVQQKESVTKNSIPYSVENISGVWFALNDSIYSGLQLNKDSSLFYLNNFSITGTNWVLQKDSLTTYFIAGRNPSAQPITYLLQSLTKNELTLSVAGTANNNHLVYRKYQINDSTDFFLGRWTGVEGNILEVIPHAYNSYAIVIVDMDGTKETFIAKPKGNTLEFTRNNKQEILKAVTGDETGLKWLAEKKNCIMINEGEGYCR